MSSAEREHETHPDKRGTAARVREPARPERRSDAPVLRARDGNVPPAEPRSTEQPGGDHARLARPDSPLLSAQRTALLLSLQQSHGNRYVQRLLASASSDPAGGSAGESSVPRGRGDPLAGATRADMERRFGTSFGAVRLHTDAAAADSARSLGARAFTTGQDVYFAQGAYRPETGEGRRLLAHELAHTVQQR